jgi:hypothetical protein
MPKKTEYSKKGSARTHSLNAFFRVLCPRKLILKGFSPQEGGIANQSRVIRLIYIFNLIVILPS